MMDRESYFCTCSYCCHCEKTLLCSC